MQTLYKTNFYRDCNVKKINLVKKERGRGKESRRKAKENKNKEEKKQQINCWQKEKEKLIERRKKEMKV